MKRVNNASNEVEYYGFLVDLLNTINGQLGEEAFEYEIIESESGLYGWYQQDEQEWNGLVSEMSGSDVRQDGWLLP